MVARSSETISCYDCGNSVSFSAKACPHCGSTEPSGPYQWSRKEARRHRIEERNDRTMIVLALALGAIGAFYGATASSTTLSATLFCILYGLLGVLIGVPLAFVINVTRHWR